MNNTQQQGSGLAGQGNVGPQLDPQGLLGSLLGGALGGFVGNRIGGSTGQTVGGWAGRVLGGLLPLEAGPQLAQAPQPVQGPSQLELQSFWDVIGKIAGGVQTGLNIGHQFGLFQAGPPAADAQPSQLEMQGFFDVIRKVVGGVQTGLNVAHQLGIFSADPTTGRPAARPEISEIEAQCFGKVITWLAKYRPQSNAAQQGIGASPLSVGPQGQAVQPTQLELQNFWSVLGTIAKGVQTGLGIGHQIGLFDAGPAGLSQPIQQANQQPSPQPSQVELQGFWDTLRKIAGGVQTGLNIGKQFGLFEAGPPQPQHGAPVNIQQAQALLQQALPALQALAQNQQNAPSLH